MNTNGILESNLARAKSCIVANHVRVHSYTTKSTGATCVTKMSPTTLSPTKKDRPQLHTRAWQGIRTCAMIVDHSYQRHPSRNVSGSFISYILFKTRCVFVSFTLHSPVVAHLSEPGTDVRHFLEWLFLNMTWFSFWT